MVDRPVPTKVPYSDERIRRERAKRHRQYIGSPFAKLTPQYRICRNPQCGAKNPISALYCIRCGKRFKYKYKPKQRLRIIGPLMYKKFDGKMYIYYASVPFWRTDLLESLQTNLHNLGFHVQKKPSEARKMFYIYIRSHMLDAPPGPRINRCAHCGIRWKTVEEKLSHLSYDNQQRRTWQGHIQFMPGRGAYSGIIGPYGINYCESCGKPLAKESISIHPLKYDAGDLQAAPALHVDVGRWFKTAGMVVGGLITPDIVYKYKCSRCGFGRSRTLHNMVSDIELATLTAYKAFGQKAPTGYERAPLLDMFLFNKDRLFNLARDASVQQTSSAILPASALVQIKEPDRVPEMLVMA